MYQLCLNTCPIVDSSESSAPLPARQISVDFHFSHVATLLSYYHHFEVNQVLTVVAQVLISGIDEVLSSFDVRILNV